MKRKRRAHTLTTQKPELQLQEYPVATIAFYGPDNSKATKVAVGIVPIEGGDCKDLEYWFCDAGDIRYDNRVGKEVVRFISRHEVKSVVIADGIMGCPHQEGIDHPHGTECPRCPFWSGRDRFTGDYIN